MDYYASLFASKLSGGGGGGGGTKYSYKLGDDGFYLGYIGIGISGGNITTNNNNNRRTTITMDKSEKPINLTPTPATLPSIHFYPIPIPSDAARVEVAITPSTQYVALNVYSLTNGSYSRTHDSGWQLGSYSYSFNEGDKYLIVTTKYDSSGTSYPDNPTDFTIDFF